MAVVRPGDRGEIWCEQCNDYKMLPDGWGEKVHDLQSPSGNVGF